MRIAILLLAAGRSQRFISSAGEHKLTVDLDHHPLFSYTLAQAMASGLDTYVISQPDHAAVHRLVSPSRLITYPSKGMGESIAQSVRATAHYQGWLVALGDMPLIQATTYQAVAQQLTTSPIVRPVINGHYGHPVGFQRRFYHDLVALQGDQGARTLLAKFPAYPLSLTDQGCLIDIDTAEDLQRIKPLFSV